MDEKELHELSYRLGHADGIAQAQATLRDQFAMAALTGWLASGGNSCTRKEADDAYMMADAMLTAREAKP